jgi:CheY-like chemotaxis protein
MNQHIILWADDDAEDRCFMNEALKTAKESFLIVEAVNGQEALSFLNGVKNTSSIPCLIILDLNMPLINGREVLTFLKSDSNLDHIPVVVFTSSASDADKEFCEKYSVRMITKPSTEKQFVGALTEMITLSTVIRKNDYPKTA